MSKEIKLSASIEIDDNESLDELMIKHAIESLENVKSCNIKLEDTSKTSDSTTSAISSASISEISAFIRGDSDKIYYGSLTFEERKSVAMIVIRVANFDQIEKNSIYKKKVISSLSEKFEIEEPSVEKLFNDTNDPALLSVMKGKFLEGDLTQMFIYIWERMLSIGEEDDFESELVETTGEKFSFEKQTISETKKQGNERAKINKAVDFINSGKTPYNKLIAFEKTVLISLMLTECSTMGGEIPREELTKLRNILNITKFQWANYYFLKKRQQTAEIS